MSGLPPPSKKGRSVRKFRICVLGPSFVGKTQIVNRFVNNSFSPYYEPTTHALVYRRAFNINEENTDPQYVELEILDVFPHDHPLLDKEPDFSELAGQMSRTLNEIVKNSKENEKIHGYMFVYDASIKYTFDTLTCLIETIKEIEKSERRGKKAMVYCPKKIIVGNKKDLKKKKQVLDKNDIKKLELIKFKEVSALTNQGVQEAFKLLISDIQSCNILHKEFYDQEKLKNRDLEELKEIEDQFTGMKPVKTGGLFSLLPSFGCGAREEQVSEDEDGKESSQEEEQDEAVKAKGEEAKEESNCRVF